MIRHSLVAIVVFLSTLVALLSPVVVSAQRLQLHNIDRGVSDRSWTYKRKPPIDAIFFGWLPALDFGSTIYYLRAKCDIDNNKAKNKVIFQNITLLGVDSDNSVGATKASKLIKKGKGKVALWDLTPHVSNFLSDSAVLVSGEIKTTKQLKRFDTLTCELSVWEIIDINSLSEGTEAERLRYFRDEIEGEGPSGRLFEGRTE